MPRPAIHPLVFSLAGFALGVGLTTAWLGHRTSASATPGHGESASVASVNGSFGESEPPPRPWKAKPRSSEQPRKGASPDAPTEDPAENRPLHEGLRAWLHHQARLETLELATRLGLTPAQMEEFLAVRLADIEGPGGGSQALDSPRIGVLGLCGRSRTWLELNLTSEQKLVQERYEQVLVREGHERYAGEKLGEISRVIDLTEEQREALRLRLLLEAPSGPTNVEFEDFIHYGEPIEAAPAGGVPTNVVITESRIEMPVFSRRDPWLSEILAADQLAAYRAYESKRRELESLWEEEMRKTGAPETGKPR